MKRHRAKGVVAVRVKKVIEEPKTMIQPYWEDLQRGSV